MACSTVSRDKAQLMSAICSDKPIIFVEHVLLFNGKDAFSCEMWRACKVSSAHHSHSQPFT